MGMACYLRQIRPELLEKMKKDPQLVYQLVKATPTWVERYWQSKGADTENVQAFIEFLSTRDQVSSLLRLHLEEIFSIRTHLKQTLGDDLYGGKVVDMSKSWLAIHTTLAGDTELKDTALDKVLMDGHTIGNDRDFFNSGTEAPHYLTPDEVKAVRQLLSPITETDYKEKYLAVIKKYKDDLPYGFDGDEQGFKKDWELFQELRTHYQSTAENGLAMLVFFS